MHDQSLLIHDLVECNISWVDLYNKLKALQSDKINTALKAVQDIVNRANKYHDDISNDRNDEVDDLMKKIKKVSNILNEETLV